MIRYIMIGAGGHARVLADALRTGGIVLSGVASTDKSVSAATWSVERIYSDSDVLALGPENAVLVNGVGTVGNSANRQAIFDRFRAAGFSFASVVHSAAIVATNVDIGEGGQVMAGAILQTGVKLGADSIVNTGAIIDHDTRIGDHTHVAPGACIAGDVSVGHKSHIGAGATVIQGRSIGDNVIVGAGAVVVSDIPDGVTVVGIPARQIEIAKSTKCSP